MWKAALLAACVLIAASMWASRDMDAAGDEISEELVVLWTSGDPDVAHRVCFMYTHNAKKQGWFADVTLIVWGPSQRLLVADKDIQKAVLDMKEDGVAVQACIACAESFGIVEDIEALGIEVKPMGVPLTRFLQDDAKVVTF
jgi:hypothetical protein